MNDRATKSKQRLAVYLSSEAFRQIGELMRALNVESRSSIIAQAIARWHSQEPLVQNLLSSSRSRKKDREEQDP